jgi:hypothetical protein
VSRRDTCVTNPDNGTDLNDRALEVVETVSEIATKKDTFLERVAGQVEKVLTHLDRFSDPQKDWEAENRLAVLEKAEWVGSRAYGLSQNDAPHLLINLSALNVSDFELSPAVGNRGRSPANQRNTGGAGEFSMITGPDVS